MVWRICKTIENISNQSRDLTIAQRNYYLANTNIDISTTKILDDIINDILTQYKLINFSVLEQEGKLYITDKMQTKMVEDVFRDTYVALSPHLMNKLLLLYNQTYLEDYIAKKVQYTVLNYVIETNGSYSDEKK